MKAAFISNMYKANEFSHLEISQILSDIKTEKYKHALARLPAYDTEAYKIQKKKLPAWAFSGTFKGSIENKGFLESNGLFHIDIDGLENIETVKSLLIDSIPELYAIWLSPSRRGLKGLIRIADDFIHNDDDFKKAFYQISDYIFKRGIKIDQSCKDVRRLCYVCSDKDIYINEAAPAFMFDMQKWNYVEPPKQPSKPVNHSQPAKQYDNAEQKYIDRACDVILRAGKGDFHNARLRAGKLAGGMISGGLVRDNDIITALEKASDEIHNKYGDSEATRKSEHKALLDGIASGRMQPVEPDKEKRVNDGIDYSTMPDYSEIPDYPDDYVYDPYHNVVDFETSKPFGQSTPKPQAPPKGFKFINAADLLSREYKTNWLVKGLFERNTMGLIFGNSASGKSLLVQDLAWCVSNGWDFKGHSIKEASKVAYICGEGFFGLMKRFRALQFYYGGVPDNLFISEQPAAFMDLSSAAAVSEGIKEFGGCDLIIIDTFHRNMGAGDENSSKDFAQFLSNIDFFIKPLDATIIIIHHSGHDNKERSRGSSSIRASMDFEYQVNKDEDIGITTIKNTKMKDFEPPKPLSFRFNPIDIDLIDDDGEKVMGVILESTDEQPTNDKKRPLDQTSQKVFSALFDALKAYGVPCPNEVKTYFKTTPENAPLRVVHIDDFRPFAYPFFDVPANNRRTVLTRTIKKLESHSKCMFYNGYLWIC
jgi:hypothetical protein